MYMKIRAISYFSEGGKRRRKVNYSRAAFIPRYSNVKAA